MMTLKHMCHRKKSVAISKNNARPKILNNGDWISGNWKNGRLEGGSQNYVSDENIENAKVPLTLGQESKV